VACPPRGKKMPDKEWKTGDKVKLASGGPEMTVKDYGQETITGSFYVECQWFDKDHKLQTTVFEPDQLVAVDD
jgi:uncharacterized protein YodC (DUF2158 family)